MNNEEFDRRMEFFLNQQTRFDAGMQQLREAQAQTEQKLDRTAELAARNEETLAELTSLTYEGFSRTLGGFKDTNEKINETNAKINALVDSQILTEEKLQRLIVVVDRHISEGHAGA